MEQSEELLAKMYYRMNQSRFLKKRSIGLIPEEKSMAPFSSLWARRHLPLHPAWPLKRGT